MSQNVTGLIWRRKNDGGLLKEPIWGMKNVVNIDGLTTFTSPSFPESHSVRGRFPCGLNLDWFLWWCSLERIANRMKRKKTKKKEKKCFLIETQKSQRSSFSESNSQLSQTNRKPPSRLLGRKERKSRSDRQKVQFQRISLRFRETFFAPASSSFLSFSFFAAFRVKTREIWTPSWGGRMGDALFCGEGFRQTKILFPEVQTILSGDRAQYQKQIVVQDMSRGKKKRIKKESWDPRPQNFWGRISACMCTYLHGGGEPSWAWIY